MRIATVQFSADADPEVNLRLITEQIGALAGRADLVVFPEASMRRFGLSLREYAQPLDGPWAGAVAAAARSAALSVVVGMFTPSTDDADPRIRNTLLIAGPDGTVVGYDKIHLYDAFGFAESTSVQPGSAITLVEIGGVRVGVATCYDIRFPELFRALAGAGAEVILVPTSWGDGPDKLAQWQVLTRARALDTASWVVAVDQALPEDPAVRSAGPTGIGHSAVVDPFGRVSYEAGESAETVVHDLDTALVARARDQLGVLANRVLSVN